MGKSKSLEILSRAVIDRGRALVVLDGKGEIVDNILAYCIEQQLSRRVLVIDPQLADWAVGLNLLEPQGEGTDAATHAELVMEAIKKIFGEQHDFMPLLEKWLPSTAEPLILRGLTLAEAEEFASGTDPMLRHAVLHDLGPDVRRVALRWAELAGLRQTEQAMQTLAVQNRAAVCTAGSTALAMFGQTKTTIRWREVMDSGGIVLIRAYQTHDVSQRLAQTIGVTVVQQLMQAARARPKDRCPDAWVVADEFQSFASETFVRGLAQMRDRHLWFILSNQSFSQLAPVPGLVEAIETNCDGRLYFALSHRDAELVVHDLFQGYLSEEHIRWITRQTKYDPRETTREIHSQSWSESESDSDVYMDLTNVGDSVGFSQPCGGHGFLGSYATGSSRGHSSSSGASHTTARAQGGGIATVPWYEYKRFLEETSRQFYGIPDLLERCKTWVMTQHVRRAQFQLSKSRPAIPIVTRFIDEPCIDPVREVPRFLAKVLPRCARPKAEVLREIEERRASLLLAYEEAIAEEEARRQASPRASAATVAERLRTKAARRCAR